MPFQYVPLTVEVTLIGDHEGDPRVSVFHYRYPSGTTPTLGELSLLCDEVSTRILNVMRTAVSDLTRWTAVKARDIAVVNGLQFIKALSPPRPGTVVSEPLPGVVNFALKKNVSVSGRHTFGLIFVPDLTESEQNDGYVNNGYLQVMGALAIQLASRNVLPSWPPVVASKKHHAFYPITSISFKNTTNTLVTRQRGRRRHHRRA